MNFSAAIIAEATSPFAPRVRSFADVLAEQARERADDVAFTILDGKGAPEGSLTFSELDSRARSIAAALLRHDLGGHRVLLAFPQGLEFVAALFGCFYAGVIAVPLPYVAGKRTAERIAAIRRACDPSGILSPGRLRDDGVLGSTTTADGKNLAWVDTDAVREADGEGLTGSALEPSRVALLQYTSGSTGTPKGVVISHGNLVANAAMIQKAFGDDTRTCGVSWLPPFHDMGLVGHVLQPVYLGVHSVLMSPLAFLQRPARWLEAVSRWRATTSGGPAGAYDLCLQHIREEETAALDLSCWRVAYCGSEKVRPDILSRFADRFAGCGFSRSAILPCYGLAEATLLVSGRHGLEVAAAADPGGDLLVEAASCGPPAPDCSVRIVDPDSGEEVPEGSVGEIWVAGPHIAQGYYGDDADPRFGARLADCADPHLRTGDLGFLRGGELFVVGRIKDLIIVNGAKHSAEDIEETVAASDPVFAGSVGAAFAIEGEGREEAIVVQEVSRAFAAAALRSNAAAKAAAAVVGRHGLRVRDVVLVRTGRLPRTSSGKVQRGKARQAYLDGAFERLEEQ